MKFSLTSKLTSNLMFGLLAASVLMGCRAGIVPSASSINLDDSKAPFIVDQQFEETPAQMVRPQWSEGADPKVVEAFQGKMTDLELLSNPVVQADFKGLEKRVEVRASVQTGPETSVSARFVGNFLMDGKAYLRDPSVPFVVVIAQCLEDCQSILLHTVLMDKKDGKTVLFTDQAVAELKSSADSKVPAVEQPAPDFTPSKAKGRNKQPDFSADVAGVASYPPPVIDPAQLKGLVARTDYENSKTTGNLPAQPIPSAAVPELSVPVPSIQRDQVVGTGIVFGELAGGIQKKLDLSPVDFPLPLSQEFTGQAEGCYGVFRDQTNRVFCSRGGSLSLANLVAASAVGYTRYAEEKKSYASGLTLRFIQVLAEFYDKNWPEQKLDVGNVSAKTGGVLRFTDSDGAHTTHQNGLEVDLMVPFKTPVVRGATLQTVLASTDYDRLWALVKQMSQMTYTANGQALPVVNRVYLDKRHILKLCPLAKADAEHTKAVLLLQHIVGHTTHFHVRLEATPHNPSARIVIVKPAANLCGV